jgi:heavy metal sensor kinase
VNARSIRFRLSAWHAALLVLVVLAFGAYAYFSVQGYLLEVLKNSQRHRAEQIAEMFASELTPLGEKLLVQEVEDRFDPELNDRFVRISKVNAGTISVSGPPNDRSFDPARVPLLSAPWPPTMRTRQVDAQGPSKLLIVSKPVTVGRDHYLIEVGASTAGADSVLRGLLVTLAVGLPAVSAVAAIGGYSLLNHAFAPVRTMIETADEITLRDLDKRIPVPGTGDELERLAITLNQMIGRLHESFQTSRRFTSDASHELRTPLTIMRGELEALLLRQDLPEGARDRASSLLEETDRLIGITEGLVKLSRLDSGEAQREHVRFDLAALADTTVDQMSLLAEEKRIELTFRGSPFTMVAGDRARVKQVIVNLLDNAIKYTPVGGEVSVLVDALDRRARLRVDNTGPAIPPEALPRVFDRFFRVDEARSREVDGAGLGLSIVQAICTAHAGSVRAENLLTGGCRFTVELPLAS